jgi:hypothetical protein
MCQFEMFILFMSFLVISLIFNIVGVRRRVVHIFSCRFIVSTYSLESVVSF